MKEKIYKILNGHVESVKLGNDGDYSNESAILSEEFDEVVKDIMELMSNSLSMFFNNCSDNSNLEASEQEKLELDFKYFIKSL